MSDIRDWGAFVRGRWDWTKHGYERGFPRGCQFTDVDAAIEFDGHRLIIEPKHFDGEGQFPPTPIGQRRYLEDEAALGKTVFVLFGCGACNDPYAVEYFSTPPESGQTLYDWRGHDKPARRERLKRHIDWALGVGQEKQAAA